VKESSLYRCHLFFITSLTLLIVINSNLSLNLGSTLEHYSLHNATIMYVSL
jgi:hypothetical protein